MSKNIATSFRQIEWDIVLEMCALAMAGIHLWRNIEYGRQKEELREKVTKIRRFKAKRSIANLWLFPTPYVEVTDEELDTRMKSNEDFYWGMYWSCPYDQIYKESYEKSMERLKAIHALASISSQYSSMQLTADDYDVIKSWINYFNEETRQ